MRIRRFKEEETPQGQESAGDGEQAQHSTQQGKLWADQETHPTTIDVPTTLGASVADCKVIL